MLLTNFISIYLLSVTVAVVFCTVQIRAMNGSRYTLPALLLCFAVCFYILGYVMELSGNSYEELIFWNRLEYIGIPFVSALWLTTGLMYTGCFERRRKLLFVAIFLIPIITLVLRLTNDYHYLYFSSVSYTQALDGLMLVKKPGVWMTVQAIHSGLMILASLALFIYDSVKRAGEQIGSLLLISVSSASAIAGLFLSQKRPMGLPLDYMALCLPLTCMLVIVAILRYDLIETKAIARSRVFDASRDAILLMNRQNRVVDFNRSAEELFSALGISMDNRMLLTHSPEAAAFLAAMKKTEPSVVKLRVHQEDRYFNISSEQIGRRGMPGGWIKNARDVTELYQLNEELKRQAMTDELSALSNRRAFLRLGQERLAQAEGCPGSVYLLMLDLDHFKDVNDCYGHPTGDLVIKQFAGLLKAHFTSPCLIARLGGEEFAIMLA